MVWEMYAEVQEIVALWAIRVNQSHHGISCVLILSTMGRKRSRDEIIRKILHGRGG